MATNLPNAKRKNLYEMLPTDLVIVGLDTDDAPGTHPLIDDERNKTPIDESLVQSIQEYGVVEPVVVRKAGDRAEVIDGRRRVRHARIANERLASEGLELQMVRVVIQPRVITDEDAAGLMIMLNEQREQDSMVNRSAKLRYLVDKGVSDKKAAVFFRVTTTAIRNWKSLLSATDEVLEAVDKGQLSASAATELAQLDAQEQNAKLEGLVQEAKDSGKSKVTAADARRVRRQSTKSTAATAFKPPRKPVIKGVIDHVAKAETSTSLPDGALDVLRWVLGEVDASDVPGLADAIAAIDAAKQRKTLKVSDPQLDMLRQLEKAPVMVTELHKKIAASLEDKQLIEAYDGDDGVRYVRLTASAQELLEQLDAADRNATQDSDTDGDAEAA
jgi:ParB family chromosome partitioning protein